MTIHSTNTSNIVKSHSNAKFTNFQTHSRELSEREIKEEEKRLRMEQLEENYRINIQNNIKDNIVFIPPYDIYIMDTCTKKKSTIRENIEKPLIKITINPQVDLRGMDLESHNVKVLMKSHGMTSDCVGILEEKVYKGDGHKETIKKFHPRGYDTVNPIIVMSGYEKNKKVFSSGNGFKKVFYNVGYCFLQ